MKILVTGGNGFIGTVVCAKLRERGHEVIIFDRKLPSREFHSFLGDIKDTEAVNEAIYNSDAVIHLAGLLGTAELVNNPKVAVEVNILGTLNVFEAIRTHKKRAVYLTLGNYFMNNTYSITKSTSERFALMFNKEHGTDIRIVRAMNCYGPGQKSQPVRKFFPNMVKQALHNEPITVYGDGMQIMDLVYIDDLAEILISALLTENVPNDKIYEAGTGKRLTLNEVIAMIIELSGSKSTINHVPMRAGEPAGAVVMATQQGLADTAEYLGFNKFTVLPEGISKGIAWYKKQM